MKKLRHCQSMCKHFVVTYLLQWKAVAMAAAVDVIFNQIQLPPIDMKYRQE